MMRGIDGACALLGIGKWKEEHIAGCQVDRRGRAGDQTQEGLLAKCALQAILIRMLNHACCALSKSAFPSIGLTSRLHY